MRDMVYNVKRVVKQDGLIVYQAYENNLLIDEFTSERKAWKHIEIYKRLMR